MKSESSVVSGRERAAAAPTRVLVVDDHVFIAQLLENFLRVIPGFACAGIASNGDDALRMVESLKPELLILDLNLPGFGGLEIVQELSRRESTVRILIFSGLNNLEAVRHALQFGVQGFLEKNTQLDEFATAVKAVRDGDFFISPTINASLRTIVRQSLRDPLLDATDLKVLRLFADHAPVKSIADEVGLSQSGVYKVLSRLRRKAGSDDKRDMDILAAKLGLAKGPTHDLWK